MQNPIPELPAYLTIKQGEELTDWQAAHYSRIMQFLKDNPDKFIRDDSKGCWQYTGFDWTIP